MSPAKTVAGVTIGAFGTLISWLAMKLFSLNSLAKSVWPWLSVAAGVLFCLSTLLALTMRRTARHHLNAAAAAEGVDLSMVVGRDDEKRKIIAFLASDEKRFLCIEGDGGVGKTTLALKAASDLPQVAQIFVALDAVEPRGLGSAAIDEAIAVAVATRGLNTGIGGPLMARESASEAVSTRLRRIRERTILILDNAEQIAARVGLLAQRWAEANSHLRIVVTSRVPLNVHAEKVFPLAGLSTHTAATAPSGMLGQPKAALRLFEQIRARRMRFALTLENVVQVNRICRALEGVPLGIALAAETQRTLTEIEEGLAGLRSTRADLPPRQRSLQAVIDWSLGFLHSESRTLAIQLSVAPGELDDGAIAGIVAEALPPQRLRECLAELCDTHLVTRHDRDGRSVYQTPVVVRHRCRDLRISSGDPAESQAWNRFARTFVARGEAAHAQRFGAGISEGLDAIERDYDNLLAIAQQAEQTDPILAARAGLCLAWMIRIRRPSEPRLETLGKLEANLPGDEHVLRARVKIALGQTCLDLVTLKGEDRAPEADRLFSEAAELAETSGDRFVASEAHDGRAQALIVLRRNDGVEEIIDDAVTGFVASGSFAAAALACTRYIRIPPVGRHGEKLAEAKRLLGTRTSPLVRFDVLWSECRVQFHTQTTRPGIRRTTDEMREIALHIGSGTMYARALQISAIAEDELDNRSGSMAFIEEEIAIHQAAGSTVEEGLALSNLADKFMQDDPTDEDLDRAIELLNTAERMLAGRVPPDLMAITIGNRAWALFERGRLAEAVRDGEAAASRLAEMSQWDPQNAFILSSMLARIHLSAGDAVSARHWEDRAQALAAENGYSEDDAGAEVREHMRWLRQRRQTRGDASDQG